MRKRRNRTIKYKSKKVKCMDVELPLCKAMLDAREIDKALDKTFGKPKKRISGRSAFCLGLKHA